MKSFQFFKEDSQEAKERQLQSLKDLEARRERAQTKSREIAGTFKQRSKKTMKRIITKHKQMNLDYQQKRESESEKK